MIHPLKTALFLFLAISVTIASAQESCSAILDDALNAVDEFCAELGRNQACYGNVDLQAEAQADVSDFSFDALGDIVDVADILTLELSELNETAGTWGVAVMSLQADIPNTIPGQNVTFILFGDVAIENASTEEQTPMQAFYLRTGVGNTSCEDAPDSGLLIQTPDGVDEVTFNVNGVDVQVGSTVLFETENVSDDEVELVMSTVEGSLAVQFDEENYPVIEGTQVRLPLNNELLPVGRPDLPSAYEETRMARLPIRNLPRQISLAPPLVQEALAELRERVQNGEAPCGVDGLPRCENLLRVLRTGQVPSAERWGQLFEAGENCIALADIPSDAMPSVDLGGLSTALDTLTELPFCPPSSRANRTTSTRAIANNTLDFRGDADNDGIINMNDACPIHAGLAEFSGCESQPVDNDGDGFPDALDFCPYEAGDNRGCANAPDDADGDGFPDLLDFCPDIAGNADFRGCPDDPREIFEDITEFCAQYRDENTTCPVDVDGDGVANAQDNCPRQVGTRENNGCPPR